MHRRHFLSASTPQALGEIVAHDRARWADVVAKRGIKAAE
jgi:hypothetical protein